MASNIKGLTVEIGGDTSKLGKALQDVQKKSKSLSSELGEINRLLKMDPGNADLLAQKQKVLAEAVETTRKKLETLRAASEQAAKTAGNYDAWKAKYDPLSAEIETVTEKLKALKAKQAEMEEVGDVGSEAYKLLQEEVAATSAKLKTLRKQVQDVNAEFGNPASPEQLRALQREVAATEGKLKGYERAAQQTAEEVERLGQESDDTADDMDDTGDKSKKAAGDVEDFGDAADKAEKSGGGLGKTLGGVLKGGLALVAAACAAAIAGLVAAAESTREYRAEMGKLETAFVGANLSADAATKTYKTLQGVIGETDQSVEAAQQIALLASSEEEAAKWADLAAGVVGKFGDALQPEAFYEAANETLKLGEATGAYAQALEQSGFSVETFNEGLAACNTYEEKQAYMLEVSNAMLERSADLYRENNAEIIRANEANEAWTASLAEIGGAIEPIITDVKMLGASLLSDLVPGVQSIAEAFRGILSGDAGAADALGTALSGMITQLLNKVRTLAPTVMEVALSLITTLTTSLLQQLPHITRTLMLMLEEAIIQLGGILPGLLTSLIDSAMGIVTNLLAYLPDVISALMVFVGQLGTALPGIIAQISAWLPEVVDGVVTALALGIPALIQGAVQFFLAIVQAIPVLIESLVPQIPGIVTSIIDVLVANIPVLLDGAVQLLNAIVQAIPILIQTLVPQIPVIVNTITTKLAEAAPVLLSAAVQLLWEILKAIPVIVSAIFENAPAILQAIFTVMNALPSLLWKILAQVLGKVGEWIGNMATKAKEAGSKFLSNVVNFIKQLPEKARSFLSQVISRVTSWASDMASKAKSAGSNFINNAVSFIKQLPGKIWSFLTQAVTKVATWGTNMVSKAKSGMKNVISSVTTTLKELPSKVLSIGKDLVTGLWNGVSNKLSWLKGKISGFADSVLGSIKSFFGVHSPSTETAWIGDMLDQGLAKGVLDNASAPIRAMQEVSGEVIGAAAQNVGGISLERNLQTSSTAAQTAAASGGTGMLAKLDAILAAIERGQVIAIDGKQLIGATADGYDTTLGRRRALVARGAL